MTRPPPKSTPPNTLFPATTPFRSAPIAERIPESETLHMTHGHPVRTGGQILIDQLRRQGVERVTCVPGESYLAALDALHDSGVEVVICRNEGGAAMKIGRAHV